MTLPDLLHQLREEEGRAEDTLMEGEVNLILLFHPRLVYSNSNMSNRLSKITHLFGWEQGIRAVCVCVCFKENAEECVFVAHALDSVN